MKNKELFDRTIGVLVKAYFKGELKHSSSCGCGVANLIASSLGFNVVLDKSELGSHWKKEGCSYYIPDWPSVHGFGVMRPIELGAEKEYANGVAELESTGYKIEETCKIEGAFESRNILADPDGYLGLMAVIDILQEIHECSDEEREAAKIQFNKA